MFKGAGSERGNVLSCPLRCPAVDFIWSAKPGISSWSNLSWAVHRLPAFHKNTKSLPISQRRLQDICSPFISEFTTSGELDKHCYIGVCERLESVVTSVTPPLTAKRSSKWHLKIAGVDWITGKWMQCLLLAESWGGGDTACYMNLKWYLILKYIFIYMIHKTKAMAHVRCKPRLPIWDHKHVGTDVIFETCIILQKRPIKPGGI